MASTKLTRKGQVTIPAEIREKLELREGDILSVREDNRKVILESTRDALHSAIEAIRLHAKDAPHLTPEEHDDVVAAAIVEDYLESIADR